MEEVKKRNKFLLLNNEDADFNQYWYSIDTIEAMVDDCVEHGGGSVAFLSTPSIYFSLPQDARKNCKCFDIDRKWEKDSGFVYFDFNKTECIPPELLGTFKMVCIDPPFITREVWVKYAEAAKMLLNKEGGGLVLASTIQENSPMMAELLGVQPAVFKPSIPHLVYQYCFYVNYDSTRLGVPNPEIPE